jgi:hypothetical protein
MAAPEPSPTLEWVVCFGETREVVAGWVSCPFRGSRARVADCLDCRHLTDAPDDRAASRWCSAGEDDAR